eukprot:scaffold14429_cov20-Tisochrysis_lutea.AAC.1
MAWRAVIEMLFPGTSDGMEGSDLDEGDDEDEGSDDEEDEQQKDDDNDEASSDDEEQLQQQQLAKVSACTMLSRVRGLWHKGAVLTSRGSSSLPDAIPTLSGWLYIFAVAGSLLDWSCVAVARACFCGQAAVRSKRPAPSPAVPAPSKKQLQQQQHANLSS